MPKRPIVWPWYVAIVAIGTCALAAKAEAPPRPAPLVQAVDSIGLTVGDLDRSVGFFRDVLMFEKVSETEVTGEPYERLMGVFGLRMRTAIMQLGQERVELTEYLAPRGRPMPLDSCSNDLWFQHIAIVVSDMDRAYAHLRQHRVEHASTGPQTLPDWNRSAAGIRAFYFRDPDGHFLEILQFPPDKGDPKWHGEADRLFLGIDHTAIVVADTDESLKLYRDALGLHVAGTSENYGTEQEHLNNVFGARLRITTLRSDRGPGIELLEYLAPRNGRPAPDDTRANDLWHWQVRLRAVSSSLDTTRMRGPEARWVSPGPVAFSTETLGFSEGMLLRDPDGHALLLVAP